MALRLYGDGNIENVDSITTSASATLSSTELGYLDGIGGIGKILQVVSATHSTEVSTTSTSYITTNLSASITPSSTSSKVLIHVSMPLRKTTDNIFSGATGGLFRGTVGATLLAENVAYAPGANVRGLFATSYVDSPNTTSSQVYTVGLKTNSNLTTVASCPDGNRGSLVLMEISA